MSSGEARLPMLCLSSTSEDTGADVTSSQELFIEQKLVLLDVTDEISYTNPQPSKCRKCFSKKKLAKRIEGLRLVFYWLCLHC